MLSDVVENEHKSIVSDRMAPNLKETRQRVGRVASKVSNYLKDGTTANRSLAGANVRVSNP